MTAAATEAVVKRVREATALPLWVKLTPNTGDIVAVARAAERAGANALVIANRILAMAIDGNSFRPRLGNAMGGLSGPAVKPIIVRLVYQCARVVDIPIVECGGIMTGEDAAEYLLAGASAVQVGTATFIHPTAMLAIIEGLERFCASHGVERMADLIGAVNSEGTEGADLEWKGMTP